MTDRMIEAFRRFCLRKQIRFWRAQLERYEHHSRIAQKKIEMAEWELDVFTDRPETVRSDP